MFFVITSQIVSFPHLRNLEVELRLFKQLHHFTFLLCGTFLEKLLTF